MSGRPPKKQRKPNLPDEGDPTCWACQENDFLNSSGNRIRSKRNPHSLLTKAERKRVGIRMGCDVCGGSGRIKHGRRGKNSYDRKEEGTLKSPWWG